MGAMNEPDDDIRITLRLPLSADPVLTRMCKERGMTRTALMRQAFGIYQTLHDGCKDGTYVGFTKDREALETVLLLPL